MIGSGTVRSGWKRGTVGGIGALALLSCRQIAGVEERKPVPAEATPMAGSFAVATEGCAACAGRECGDAISACAGDDACVESYSCLLLCRGNDEGCRARCYTASRDAGLPAIRLDVCLAHECATECEMSCGGWLVSGNAACNACYAQC